MANAIAIIGWVTLGLIISVAMRRPLVEMAAGAVVSLLRPFKAGDFVRFAAQVGLVEEIRFNRSLLRLPDNRRVYVRNSLLVRNNL